MNWINEVGDLLRQYQTPPVSGSAASSAPQDYDRVTQSAPPSALAGALASAIRSPNTPAFSDVIAQLFSASNPSQRTGILQHLLQSAGAALGSGSTAAAPAQTTPVNEQQAAAMSPESVRALAQEAERRDPSIIDRASAFYAQHPTLVKGLGAATLAVLMHHMASQHRAA
jgi:hypothetical protein